MKIGRIDYVSYPKTGIQKKENSVKINLQNEDNQIKSLSGIYYTPLSFGRSLKEHKSWGAQINPNTKEASFKIFTYPDTQRVQVTVSKRNNPNKKKVYELKNKGFGIFETERKIPAGEVAHGDKYSYTIYKGNGDIDTVKDPYSFRQESLLGESTIYDHSLFKWTDSEWYTNNKNRISRRANPQNGLSPVNTSKIYEFNTATLNSQGNFKAAKQMVRKLAKDGFNAIELMPVENTYSFNWGYDGVDKMAPAEHIGGPDGLKDLINYAHSQGLNVIMDMVPNHLGPDGAALEKTGPYLKGYNCFGGAFNYEGNDSRYVRDYIVNAALNWIDNYHCDGLRLDMTKFMDSDYTMKQIAAEVNYHHPDVFLIAEDARSSVSVDNDGNFYDNWDEPHDKRVMNPLKSFESGEGESEDVHCKAIENISNCNTSLGRLGFDSEWDFNYFHTLKDGLYGVVDLDKLEKAEYCAQDRVKYIMSHDEIGNFEGSRLIPKLMTPMLHLNDNITLNNEDIKRAEKYSELKNCSINDAQRTVKLQKAQFVAEQLSKMLQTGKLDKYNTENVLSKRTANNINSAFKRDILKPLGINENSGITYDIVKTMFNKSFERCKMAMAETYSIPGPKMIFQGDESADLTPFRFFRQFESIKDENNLFIEKGYKTGKEALKDSTLGNIPYSDSAKQMMNKYRALIKDLNKLSNENSALSKGKLIKESTVKHQASQVFGTHTKDFDNNNEIFCVTNFSDSDYPRKDAANYYIKFPQGTWIEILNTDDKKYAGSGNFMNTNKIVSDGISNSPIKLEGQSLCMFKRID